MVVDGKFVSASTLELDRHFVGTHYDGILNRAVQAPAKVLEVGAGYGRMLFPLSCLFPNSQFYGIEYSESGPRNSSRFCEQLHTEIAAVARSVKADASEKGDVREFKSGDGKKPPLRRR